MPAAAAATATAAVAPASKAAKPQHVPDKKYKCQFCARAFSRSEHRSRHERSRKCLPTFPLSRWRGRSHGGVVKPTFCLLLTNSPILVRRHQRTSFQMRKVPQYLCQTRPVVTTRPNRTRQRWRSTAGQRSQETAGRKANSQGHPHKAVDRCGYGDDGTNRSKQ